MNAAAGALAAPAFSQTGSRKRRPNILFLMTDQQRVDCVGAYGNRTIRTPHLDRLAGEGVLFRNAYSSTPTCTPARSALLTGLSPWRHGMLGYGEVAERYTIEMPRALRDAGYEIVYTGLHQTPEQVVRAAVDEDVDAIGLSLLSGAHMTLFPRILELLRKEDAEDIVMFGGGTIPHDDVRTLKQMGVAEIFTPGASTFDIVDWVRANVGAGARAGSGR